MNRILPALIIFALAAVATAENRVSVKLIASAETIEPGSTFNVGVLFTIPEKAHIYWINPGDSGLATEIEWRPFSNVTVRDLQWPAPKQFGVEGLDEAYFGYENETVLFSEATVPADARPGDTISIEAKAKWLLCLDDGVCIPEDENLSIEIPVAAEGRKAYESAILAKYEETVPQSANDKKFDGTVQVKSEPSLSIVVNLPEAAVHGKFQPFFFPYKGGGWTAHREGESKITFTPDYKGDPFVGGTLVIPMRHEGTSKEETAHVEVLVFR